MACKKMATNTVIHACGRPVENASASIDRAATTAIAAATITTVLAARGRWETATVALMLAG